MLLVLLAGVSIVGRVLFDVEFLEVEVKLQGVSTSGLIKFPDHGILK